MVLPVFTGEKQARQFSVDQSFDIVFYKRIIEYYGSLLAILGSLPISVVIVKKFSDGD